MMETQNTMRPAVVLITICLVTFAHSRQLSRMCLADIDDKALCNDGSPAYYYFAPGNGSSEEVVLYLEGGDHCYDRASCAARFRDSPQLMSSTGWPESVEQSTGILSESSPLSRAGAVFVKYCSSDAHMGDRGASPDTFGWNFYGARIVRAVVEAIRRRHSRGNNLKIFLGGASAGARGAMTNLDHFRTLWPDVEFLGVLDSPLWMDIPAMYPSIVSLEEQTRQVFRLVNATAVAHAAPDCATKYPDELHRCIFAQYRLPFVRPPYMLYASQYDHFGLTRGLGHMPPQNTGERMFAMGFAARVRSFLDSDIPAASVIYSTACANHAISLTRRFEDGSVAINGTTMMDALSQFMSGEIARSVDYCEGYACGHPCK